MILLMLLKYPLLQDKVALEKEVKEKSLHQIAEEIGSSYSALAYAVRRWNIIVPKRTTHRTSPEFAQAIRDGLKKKYPNGRFRELASNWRGGKWDSKYLLGRYGITIEEKQKMFDEQLGICFLCLYKFRDVWEAATDHDHKTGKVRGLLCRHCNVRMATIDDREWLKKALAYQIRFS